MEGRPGEELPPFDFDGLKEKLQKKYGGSWGLKETDLMSAALYPKVFDEYVKIQTEYGNITNLPTRVFFAGPRIGEELDVEIEHGKVLHVKLNAGLFDSLSFLCFATSFFFSFSLNIAVIQIRTSSR